MAREDKHFQDTSFGRIAYLSAGDADAPPVLFVHGIPTSGFLWRELLRLLGQDFLCIAPDLMGLGDTEVDPTGAFDMQAQADMLLELMDRLGHARFAVVCHDQGGAAAQIMAAFSSERLTCLIITNCVCYDNWPVPIIQRYQKIARHPRLSEFIARTRVTEWLETSRYSSFRRGVYDPKALTSDAIREYLRPLNATRVGRDRFRAFLLAGDCSYTERAVAGLRKFDKPTQILWAADDRFLSPSWGQKLFADIPGANDFQLVPFCGHFWQEEKPADFSAHMQPFLLKHARISN